MKCSVCGKPLEKTASQKHTLANGLEGEDIHNIQQHISKLITADFDYYVCKEQHKGICFFKGKSHTYVWNQIETKWEKINLMREKVSFT